MVAISRPSSADLAAVFNAWAWGWTRTRGTAQPSPTPYDLYIAVNQPGQVGRHIVTAHDAPVEDLAASIRRPWEFIKVCDPDNRFISCLPAPWIAEPRVYLMTSKKLAPRGTGVCPPSYREALSMPHEETYVISLQESSGSIAASGRASVFQSFVVFDQIVTQEAHRRRVLATYIMLRLFEVAARPGASTGVLVATESGRLLYEALGWEMSVPVASAVIPGAHSCSPA